MTPAPLKLPAPPPEAPSDEERRRKAAARVRRYRARRRAGLVVFAQGDLRLPAVDFLVEHGWLEQWDAEDPQALSAAVVRLLEHVAAIDLAIVPPALAPDRCNAVTGGGSGVCYEGMEGDSTDDERT